MSAAQDIPLDVDLEEKLAGCDYDEWLQAQEEHQARLQAGRRHKETDYGQGYLEGRLGKEDGMGWANYKPLAPEEVGDSMADQPQHRLNRHLWHAAATGDAYLIQLLPQAGADVHSSNNESFLPATVRYGLYTPNSYAPVTRSVNGTYGNVTAGLLLPLGRTAPRWPHSADPLPRALVLLSRRGCVRG